MSSKELFLSHSNIDKAIAREIKKHLATRGYESFLAHEDIEVSAIWRDEILKHLETCIGLIAVVTGNFPKSFWTNQEVGMAIGKNKPVISMVLDPDARRNSGFLESRQAIITSVADLEKAVEEVAQAIDRILTFKSQSYEIHTYAATLLKIVSDTKLTLTTYKDSLVDPDLTQMLLDIQNYANALDGLSMVRPAEQLNIRLSLTAIARRLDALTSLPVSIGSRYGDEFGKRAEEILALTNDMIPTLNNEIKAESLDDYSESLHSSLESFRNGWRMRERLFKTGQVMTLKETLRHHAFEFHRFALRPEATELGVAAELTELSIRLHELSSTQKYFGYRWGGQILQRIEEAYSQCETLINTIEKKIG